METTWRQGGERPFRGGVGGGGGGGALPQIGGREGGGEAGRDAGARGCIES